MARLTPVAVLLLFCATLAAPASAQTITSPEDFQGFESWPLVTPENVELDSTRLGWLRNHYQFQTRFQGDEWNDIGLVIDVFPSYFQGQDTHIIQWTTASPGGTGAIDALWIDASDHRIYQRIARAGGPGNNARGGSYDITQHHPDSTIDIRVTGEGETDRSASPESGPTFDFAAMGYLFGLMDLEEGRSFRIVNVGSHAEPAPRELYIKVGPMIDMEDGDGETRRVREVGLLNASQTQLITFYVTSRAPFLQGWDFRIVESGRLVNRVRARGEPQVRGR